MEITITMSDHLKEIPNSDDLGFGSIFTDHMFVMDYSVEEGWHNASIKPYGPMMMDPSFMVLHYGQETFEGLKAYKGPKGEVLLFRPEMNARRLNASNRRLCIPEIDEKIFIEAIKTLIGLDRAWIPDAPDTSLYIRPFVFATDPSLKVYPSHTYKFMIILSPVAAYYKEGLNPVSIYVETQYVRASVGGVGFAKTGGNYGASLIAQQKAVDKDCSQVLWLDSRDRSYVEEVGTMNVFFVKKNTLITPALSGSILPGITRDSVLEIAKAKGFIVEERQIRIEEVVDLLKKGEISEMFGTGTAAVISPVGRLVYENTEYIINDGSIGRVSSMMYDLITGIQCGKLKDEFGYRLEI